jgi:hypothetical protein
MNPGNALKEVWGWKDGIGKELAHLSRLEKIRLIKMKAKHFSTGLNLRSASRPESIMAKKS